ncbi:hypothetical protein [Lapillicoccus sp.]|uniref:hypothetical protein n=1 Tax=Lapillicoccus sp. TaxID=1909287 RepID=UPI0025F96D3D|nr:hypothetical protein [Lapillicoccus sp.]
MKSPKSSLIATVEEQASTQGNVLRLADLRDLGVTPGQRVAQARARRWAAIPWRGVVVASADDETRHRLALVEVGKGAAIGGASALLLAGLTGWDEEFIHVWVRKSFSKNGAEGVALHESRRWTPDDLVGSGIPRANPTVAAIQSALWAKTVRQAATLLAMSVQQRLVCADVLAVEFERVKRHKFRVMLRQVIADIGGGAQSMNELDFAVLCRAHGLPEPSRQERRQSSQGRIYLDVYWQAYRVRLEVNGAGHGILVAAMSDEIRTVEAQAEGDAAVQVSVLTIRVEPLPLMDALRRLLRSRGWVG